MVLRCFDPIERAAEIKSVVTKLEDGVELRKYYRFRPSRFYGGSAVADTVGCNLSCGFCWGWRVNAKINEVGEFYTPRYVAEKLINMALEHGYKYVRISGGEPTLSFAHLVEVLREFERRIKGKNIIFILETNGTIIGSDRVYAKTLSEFKSLHVRVSIKACNEKKFQEITGACAEFFNLQLKALKFLLDYGVSCHPALVVSFCEKDELEHLMDRLSEIDPKLPYELELEYVILYPHVIELLRRRGLKPRVCIDPRTWRVIEYP